jgi:hypothetical protein
MPDQKEKKIIRLLGVGFDAEDGHIRITQGDKSDVIMGSEESHEYLSGLIRDIEERIEACGLTLEELSPGDLSELVESLSREQSG